jgi:hypothetical protein
MLRPPLSRTVAKEIRIMEHTGRPPNEANDIAAYIIGLRKG